MKVLPETIIFVIINAFDSVYTTVGIHLGYLAEGNPLMAFLIQHTGLGGLVVIKMLWLFLILAAFEYSYQRLDIKMLPTSVVISES